LKKEAKIIIIIIIYLGIGLHSGTVVGEYDGWLASHFSRLIIATVG